MEAQNKVYDKGFDSITTNSVIGNYLQVRCTTLFFLLLYLCRFYRSFAKQGNVRVDFKQRHADALFTYFCIIHLLTAEFRVRWALICLVTLTSFRYAHTYHVRLICPFTFTFLQNFEYVRPLGIDIDTVHMMWTFRDVGGASALVTFYLCSLHFAHANLTLYQYATLFQQDVLASARHLLRKHAYWIGVHVRRFPTRHTDKTPTADEYQVGAITSQSLLSIITCLCFCYLTLTLHSFLPPFLPSYLTRRCSTRRLYRRAPHLEDMRTCVSWFSATTSGGRVRTSAP
jgi:hypothetical protein